MHLSLQTYAVMFDKLQNSKYLTSSTNAHTKHLLDLSHHCYTARSLSSLLLNAHLKKSNVEENNYTIYLTQFSTRFPLIGGVFIPMFSRDSSLQIPIFQIFWFNYGNEITSLHFKFIVHWIISYHSFRPFFWVMHLMSCSILLAQVGGLNDSEGGKREKTRVRTQPLLIRSK